MISHTIRTKSFQELGLSKLLMVEWILASSWNKSRLVERANSYSRIRDMKWRTGTSGDSPAQRCASSARL